MCVIDTLRLKYMTILCSLDGHSHHMNFNHSPHTFMKRHIETFLLDDGKSCAGFDNVINIYTTPIIVEYEHPHFR